MHNYMMEIRIEKKKEFGFPLGPSCLINCVCVNKCVAHLNLTERQKHNWVWHGVLCFAVCLVPLLCGKRIIIYTRQNEPFLFLHDVYKEGNGTAFI